MVKLVIVGNYGIGKTSLLETFTNDNFYGNRTSTIGVGYFKIPTDIFHNQRQMTCWDTGGQVQFKPISKMYMRDVHVCIVGFDVTCEKSFQSVSEWIQLFRETNKTQKSLVVLIGTKIDLWQQRVVSKQRAHDLANEYGIEYFETSSKNKHGLDQLFNYIVNEFKIPGIKTTVEEETTKCKCTIQ